MRPLIGVTCSAEPDGTPVVRAPYVAAVHRAGGLAVALPFLADPAPYPQQSDEAQQLIARLDGIVLTGSEDLDTRAWDEPLNDAADPMHINRQRTELALSLALLASDLPLLGICGGMQTLAVADGGTLCQHIPDLGDHVLDHAVGLEGPQHVVDAVEGSALGELLGAQPMVNTAHHQSITAVGKSMRAVGHAPDGVIEAYELPGRTFGIAVQWHPERMPYDRRQQSLFTALVDAAAS